MEELRQLQPHDYFKGSGALHPLNDTVMSYDKMK